MTLHLSTELRQVMAEAQDIAGQVGQRLSSAHLLLALFTVQNRAEILLKEKQVDEDVILAYVHTVEGEPTETVKIVHKKALQIAVGCGAEAVDCLHLLIALCGMRNTLAYELLRRSGLSVPQFRNTALSYVTGRLPRRLTVKRQSDQSVSQAPARAPLIDIPSMPPAAVPLYEPGQVEREALEDDQDDDEREMAAANTSCPPTEWDLEPTRFPLLQRLGRNLTALAAIGRIDPLVGRDREVSEVIDTLLKRRANNPLLVGEPGVGKTAIVEGLALRIVQGKSDAAPLKDRRIIELDVASMLAGTQLRGAFSEKLGQIRREVKNAKGSVVIFIDEMHTLMGAGATGDGPQDAANELKAALARGEFPCIGATTYDEYRRFIEQDAALSRRFRAIRVPEPSAEETLTILEGIAEEYARHHGVAYDREALDAAVRLSSRYITDRCLPDKAISLLDLAGSRARRSGKVRVNREAVARVVSSVASIPVDRLLMTDAERLLNMENIIGLQLIGHSRAVRSIAGVIRRNYAGFANKRPIGSFLFLGPTGVGKTECARALASFLFGSRDDLVKIDMSEYSEGHSISRLLGSPPGYVGHQEGGQLTEAVRRKPYTIVLFDEVEKAHPEVQQILLQILDDGRLTDGRGRSVDFSNVVVILTSNLGSAELASESRGQARIGFGQAATSPSDAEPGASVMAAARKAFPAELWGRMEERLFFRPLNNDDLIAIATLMLKESAAQIERERGMHLELDPGVSRHLVEAGCPDLSLGARPLRGVVRKLVEEPLAEAILAHRIESGDQIRVEVKAGNVEFYNTAQPS
ncbi:MAG TPA: ATP-dependent Clp protease ATP-binding subunit [Myxococcota bacterium]|nr:ATP-dependent Clp protease ATP-binding subunit [Myxococcota bacterium]